MLVILGEMMRRAISVIQDFVTGALQFFDESSGANGRRRFLESRLESSGARRRTYQSNLLRLTDNFDRQGFAPCVVVPLKRAGPLFLFGTARQNRPRRPVETKSL